jgi:hypothetical protein
VAQRQIERLVSGTQRSVGSKVKDSQLDGIGVQRLGSPHSIEFSATDHERVNAIGDANSSGILAQTSYSQVMTSRE